MRIGHGVDAHAFARGRRLMIGGVEIPFERGLQGHSDADVLLHAICDALIGAAGLGDIGRHFPDSDPRYKGISSRELVRATGQVLSTQGWRIINIDATVIAERPRMAPHIPAMARNIAEDLGIQLDAVNVKAKTTEQLGFIGREEGIAAEAVALIESRGENRSGAAKEETARLFFALWPSESIQGKFARWGELLDCGGRPTRRESIHLTVVFLGEVPVRRIEELKELAGALTVASFDLKFVGIDEFRRKHIIWAAPLEIPAPLRALVSDLERALRTKGFVLDERPFTAHVTLVRNTRRAVGSHSLSPIDWPIRDFTLVRSRPGSEGAHYEVIGRWNFTDHDEQRDRS